MKKITKFDVILHLFYNGSHTADSLLKQIRNNAIFSKTTERQLMGLLRSLKKDSVVVKSKGNYSLDFENETTVNILAFLIWCKKDSIDYNIPLERKRQHIFREIFEDYGTANIFKEPKFSRPTMFKILRDLENVGFISVQKRKPFQAKSLINDKTLFFANIFGYSFAKFERGFDTRFPKKQSEKLKDSLIKLHVYSTTVTEGNTATEQDVEKVLKNFSTNLSPKEVLEIVNAKSAIDEIYKTNDDVSIGLIKRLHMILMSNLVETPGEFSYIRKKVIGSPFSFPTSKPEIDISINSMINFHKKYKGFVDPLLLGSFVHFLFVSIHPFIDGNGRVARLLHSLILSKAGFPIFAFDPNHKNTYFGLLDKARLLSIEDFVKFCIEKHRDLLESI